MSFQTETNPSNDVLKKVAQLSPTNPFYTPAYCAAMRAVGHDPVVFSCMEGKADVACTGFIRSGRLNRSLEITSIPSLQADSVFWNGLLSFCRKAKVSILEVDSFGSHHAAIPSLRGETARRSRIEFVLHLRQCELWKNLRKGHRWSINRARKAGLTITRTVEPGALQAHSAVFAASMVRRKSRGELAPVGIDVHTCEALIEQGAAELFQATGNGKIMSSALVLMSKGGAHYQTAGTSSEGMECGASHFLIFEIARILQEQSMELFNLGGTELHALGLQDFKAGFGTDKVDLEAAEFFLGSRVQNGLGVAFRLLRNGLERASKVIRI